MTKPTIQIHNSETDEVVFRELTDAELVEENARKVEAKARAKAEAAKAAEKAALLAKLGITEDEARLLLG
jgi:hypothetical protein